MKRILTIVLCVAMLASSFAFTAFADELTPAATAVVEMIMELDANTKPEHLAAIRDAYAALTPEEQASVYNYDTFLDFEKTEFVPKVNELIKEIPEVEYIDLYHFEKTVNEAYAKYNVLTDEGKALVEGHEKVEAAKARIDELNAFNANKQVEILNSTMRGLSAYTYDSLKAESEKNAIGIYYYFEEVDMIERGDSTTGYYHPNNLDKITLYKYAKLEMDVKWTDIDVINGWPMPFQLEIHGSNWSGYDFVNGIFWQGAVTGMDHGRLSQINASVPYDLTYGVWHHMEVLYDDETVRYTLDGEVVFETQTEGVYDVYIIYPWLCNLEMTNVKITEKNGNSELSPFRQYVANPNWTGWTKSTNEEGITMLDYIEEALANTRAAYNALSDDEKAQIENADQIDRVQALIDQIRSGKNSVTVVGGTSDKDLAAAGETVTITANEAPEGMIFDKWIVDPEVEIFSPVERDTKYADLTRSTVSFAMTEVSITLTATYKEKPAYTPGDANGDGKVNSKDVVAIMKAIVGVTVKGYNELAADMDGNGKVNSKDVVALMKAIVRS